MMHTVCRCVTVGFRKSFCGPFSVFALVLLNCSMYLVLTAMWSLSLGTEQLREVEHPEKLHNCSRHLLMQCLTHLQSITSDQSLAFAANEEELQILCKSTEISIICIQNYSRQCFNNQQQELYRKVIGGAVEVMGDLCQDGPFRDNFLRHAACSRLTATDYDKCGQHYRKLVNGTETQRSVSPSPLDTLKKACCAYSEFVVCSTRAIAEECGAEAAEFVAQYTRRAGGPLIHTHCAPFLRDSAECSSGSALCATVSFTLAGMTAFVVLSCVVSTIWF